METFIKTYGIHQCFDGRYQVVTDIPEDKKLCKGTWVTADLDYEKFGDSPLKERIPNTNQDILSAKMYETPIFDFVFCFSLLILSNSFVYLGILTWVIEALFFNNSVAR